MRIDFTVGVYRVRDEHGESWIPLAPSDIALSGKNASKLRDQMIERLRAVLRKVAPREQELFQLPVGTELERLPLELKLDDGRAHGTVPLIVEPRWANADDQHYLVYHPRRRAEWFVIRERGDLERTATAFFRHYWKRLDPGDFDNLWSNGKDRVMRIAFSAEPRTLLDQLPSRKVDPRVRASAPRLDRVLASIAIDETRATSDEPPADVPRSPYRERLAYLLGGPRPRSVAVIGPPGSGRSSLIRRWIADRLAEDGYALHKNLDRVAHVWRLAGKRLIAGMSYLGQWEERCLAIADEARKHRGILWIEDLHLFGRLGQSRESERSFADFFRGPVRRGDLAIIAELTREQHARLERDAPGLAEALAAIAVPAASVLETSQLLLHEVRALEQRLPIEVLPVVHRTALELATALFPWRARPGVAIEFVRRLAEQSVREVEQGAPIILDPAEILAYVTRVTGLSSKLISLDEPLDADEVEAAFARRVIGQPVATRAAADVVLKVRAGLADPGRPIQVMLFTGPTGTGKTELATAIAEYLYGTPERLLRIDMGELSGPDAVGRLIGDAWDSGGLLTSRVRAQPFCVVLLDEIEKAHPQALHLLLQLFDEGRLTDAAGEVASFANAVVIMTSNLGSRSAAPIGFGETRDRILAEVARAVREFFPIELFNRIDQVVPFAPLTHEVAEKVVDKELAKLLARRGLRERNTFVYTGAAVRRRAVADAFDPRYGARTVKRWLEDRIAGALTDLLATAPPARLRIVRLSENRGEIEAALEPMRERASIAGPYVLDGALDVATSGLEEPSELAIAALARIRASRQLARARDEAQGELRYYVDALLERLAALEQRFGVDPSRDDDGDDRDDEHEDPVYEEVPLPAWRGGRYDTRTQQVRSRHAARPVASRDELLAGIAEALLIERALPELLDPDAHAITAVVSRIGTADDAAGLRVVVQALAERGWIEGVAYLRDGAVHAVTDQTIRDAFVHHRGERPPARDALYEMIATTYPDDLSRARDVALTLRGLFVRAALDTDHGTWMIRAAASEPDVVRVELRPGGAAAPADVLRAHAAGRAELERVLEKGGALPPNPDALLEVTRTLTYREPLRAGEPYHVEIEDFATGWTDRTTARDLTQAIRRARQLAWSRAGERGGDR